MCVCVCVCICTYVLIGELLDRLLLLTSERLMLVDLGLTRLTRCICIYGLARGARVASVYICVYYVCVCACLYMYICVFELANCSTDCCSLLASD